MLVLSRKANQAVLMPDHDIIIRVLEVKGRRVRLGIEAPGSVKILRAEVRIDSDAECGPCRDTFYHADTCDTGR